MPEYISGYEVGPMLAYQGKEGCSDSRCTRRTHPVIDWDRCVGYHCPHCHEPCSMFGHSNCPNLDPRVSVPA